MRHDALHTIWKHRFLKIYRAVAHDDPDHRALRNISGHVTLDYKGRFLIELLQNAIDQGRKPGPNGKPGPAEVGIVWRGDQLAVLNSGRPLEDKDIKRVTSVGLTTKDPSVDIGNKGVGFKSVYEVTTAPLLYGATSPGSLTRLDGLGRAFCLSRAPWHDPDLCAFEDSALDEFLGDRRHAEDMAELHRRLAPGEDPREHLRAETRAALAEQFPLPADPTVLLDLLADLPPELLAPMVTAVVLPLETESARDLVPAALDELRPGHRPGALLLPLENVRRIWLLTQEGEALRLCTWTRRVSPLGEAGLSRVTTREDTRLIAPAGMPYIPEDTAPVEGGDQHAKQKETEHEATWLQAKVRIGTTEASKRQVRAAIEASQLPPEAWEQVDEATIRISLPLDVPAEDMGTGRLTIAMPTQQGSHTPWWVDAPFHGTLNRKNLSLEAPYNRLLLQEATTGVVQALDWLLAEEDEGHALRAAFALDVTPLPPAETQDGEPSWNPLTRELIKREVYAREVVPGVHGPVRPSDVLVPEDQDLDGTWIRSRAGQAGALAASMSMAQGFMDEMALPADPLATALSDLHPWQLVVEAAPPDHPALQGRQAPHPRLLAHRGLLHRLRRLAGATSPARPSDLLTSRQDEDECTGVAEAESLLERAARLAHAQASPMGPLVVWACERTPNLLSGQRIVPVQSVGLVAAFDERAVFLPPDAVLDEAIPAVLAKRLHILDPERVPPLDVGRAARVLSPIAAALVRCGLIKSPRLVDLLREVREAQRDTEDAEERGMLASLALRLLRERRRREQAPNLDEAWILLPTADGAWAESRTAYFGPGWLEEPDQGRLLERAYGAGKVLVPPVELTTGPVDAELREDLGVLGVAAWPRVRKLPVRSNTVHFDNWPRNCFRLRTKAVVADHPTLAAALRTWGEHVHQRKAPTVSRYNFRFRSIEWVDGLELPDEQARAVVTLLLRAPASHRPAWKTTIVRLGQAAESDPILEVPALWAHHLTTTDRPLFQVQPTRPPGSEASTWAPLRRLWLEGGVQGPRRLLDVALRCTPEERAVLENLGVPTLHSVDHDRLVEAFRELADRVAASDVTPRRRDLTALAAALWGRVKEGFIHDEDPTWPSDTRERFLRTLLREVPLVVQGPDGELVVLPAGATKPETLWLADHGDRLRLLQRAARREGRRLLHLPLSGQRLGVGFMKELHRVSGGRLKRASIAKVSVDFAPRDSQDWPDVGAWMRAQAIERWVGLALAFGTSTPAEPDGDKFQQRWKQLASTRLELGSFQGEDAELLHFHDDTTLQLSVRDRRGAFRPPLSWVEDLAAVAGPGFADTLSLLAQDLTRSGVDQGGRDFLRRRHLGRGELRAVELALGLSDHGWLEPIGAVVEVFWGQETGTYPHEQSSGLPHAARTRFEGWLQQVVDGHPDADGGPGAKAMARLDAAEHLDEEDAGLKLLKGPQRLARWNHARAFRGKPAMRFTSTERKWREAWKRLGRELMAASPRTPGLEPDLAAAALGALQEPPASLLLDDPVQIDVYEQLRTAIEALLAEATGIASTTLRQRLPLGWRGEGSATEQAGARPLVRLYDSLERQEAGLIVRSRLRSLLRAAQLLASQLGESIDPTALEAAPRIAPFLDGPWCSDLGSAVVAVDLIEYIAPNTAARIRQAQVERMNWKDAEGLYQRLGLPAPGTTAIAPSERQPPRKPATIPLLGQAIAKDDVPTEQLEQIASGVRDLLDQAVAAQAVEGASPDPTSLVLALPTLPGLDPTSPNSKDQLCNKVPRRPRKPPTPNPEVGLLGEAFFYRWMEASYGASFTNHVRWVSGNALRFGHYEPHMDEGAGYDLELLDVDGLLAPQGTRVLIEVKSSAQAPSNRFIMSWNEWRRATQARRAVDPGEQYLVVRIGHVATARPRWVDTLVDPVGMEEAGRVRMLRKEVWVAW